MIKVKYYYTCKNMLMNSACRGEIQCIRQIFILCNFKIELITMVDCFSTTLISTEFC